MQKLISYICDELDELERKAEKGKLSMAEVEYMDTLAHAKKNLLKGEEMYSMDDGMGYRRNSYRDNRSMARGRRRYSNDAGSVVESIYNIMDELPESTRRDAEKFVKKLESVM